MRSGIELEQADVVEQIPAHDRRGLALAVAKLDEDPAGGLHRVCGVAVARSELVQSVGLDVEQDRQLDPALVESVCTPSEWRALAVRGRPHQDAIVYFSAKEAFYKCQFPLTRVFLGFHDVELTVDFESGTFRARVLLPLPRRPSGLEAARGRFLRRHALVLCGFELGAAGVLSPRTGP